MSENVCSPGTQGMTLEILRKSVNTRMRTKIKIHILQFVSSDIDAKITHLHILNSQKYRHVFV